MMNQARNVLQFTIWYQITEIGKIMEDRYLFKAKHIHILSGNDHLDGSWVVGFLSGERYIANDSGEYLIDPSTICQCTGLKDKNGNLIWENDIVNCTDAECYGYISWNESEAGFYFNVLLEGGGFDEEHIYDYQDCMEVVGNTFDNKDLLESEEKQ